MTIGGGGFQVEGAELGEDNTVTRALRRVREIAVLPDLGLKLAKRIPAMAGLGGGSSDAAGLLRIVRAICPNIPKHEFEAVARSIGADVPFFLTGGRARGSGYGDVIEPLPDLPERWLVLTWPNEGCGTASMYARLDQDRRAGAEWKPRPGWIENDFHLVAPPPCLELIEALAGHGLFPVGLSGSGSAAFGFADGEGQAKEAARAFPAAIAARTLPRADSQYLNSV